jgi:thiazole synthase
MTTSDLAPALEREEAGDPFELAGETFRSRLLLGTGGVPSMGVQ